MYQIGETENTKLERPDSFVNLEKTPRIEVIKLRPNTCTSLDKKEPA